MHGSDIDGKVNHVLAVIVCIFICILANVKTNNTRPEPSKHQHNVNCVYNGIYTQHTKHSFRVHDIDIVLLLLKMFCIRNWSNKKIIRVQHLASYFDVVSWSD